MPVLQHKLHAYIDSTQKHKGLYNHGAKSVKEKSRISQLSTKQKMPHTERKEVLVLGQHGLCQHGLCQHG